MIFEFLIYILIAISVIIVLSILAAVLLFAIENAREKPIFLIIIMGIVIGFMLYMVNPLNL